MAIGCVLALSAIIVSVAISLGASEALTRPQRVVFTIVSWSSLGAIGALIAWVSVSVEPVANAHRKTVKRFAHTVVSREDRGPFIFARFASNEPVAFAVPGRSPEIMVSTALESVLTTAQLRAVVAHEYAHLRYRHGWILRAAEVNASCLPRSSSAGQELRRATLMLIELIADDVAAKQAGAANLGNALVRLSRLTGDASMELRAERMMLRRWPTRFHRSLPEPVRV
ncbi:MAG: M56 family metallopeptidase [Brevibacterium sp.]|uniref:M56 family metallopeptidase n=1 Tax=Brevibacterium sp. TaxID=1701 RepID=UPI0026491C1B|nr:M56 family metallopeptidase [Brevibacterium sp.]MDN5833231.1 M56 family metallopeptidase [Brevibacterium sp.]MDN5875853.1 M56 family metallopeptidase [Brevibacterium sp.]MDN5908192.1 M56 family metallopeptidase [Brevibacterium sp.]MDN6122270.1 M56 family metallopeptidase [Brevibacterium sp.]MDN6132828.1 M56 family metallopeptidase [Brevibacterium sp.]